MKQILIEIFGNSTRHWTRSRTIIAGAALALYAVLANSYEYIAFAIMFIVLRFKTKDKLNARS